MSYLSKTQEWGFNGTKGYPIRILASSDYTFYEDLIKYQHAYLEAIYVDELEERDARELIDSLAKEQGLKIDDLAIDYMTRAIGGNPSILIEFISELRRKGEEVGVEDVEALIDEISTRIKNSLLPFEVRVLETLKRLMHGLIRLS